MGATELAGSVLNLLPLLCCKEVEEEENEEEESAAENPAAARILILWVRPRPSFALVNELNEVFLVLVFGAVAACETSLLLVLVLLVG